MLAVSLAHPERKLRLREVAVGRRDEAAVERVAVDQQRGLCARHGQRQPMPRAVRQPEGECLDARRRRTRRHVVQPHLVAAPARLHLQVPAQRHTDALYIAPLASDPPLPRELFRGTHKQSKQHIYSADGRDRPRAHSARSTSQYRSVGIGDHVPRNESHSVSTEF